MLIIIHMLVGSGSSCGCLIIMLHIYTPEATSHANVETIATQSIPHVQIDKPIQRTMGISNSVITLRVAQLRKRDTPSWPPVQTATGHTVSM